VLALLFFSGAAWAWFNYFLTAEDVAAAKAWAMKIHGAAAMATLVLIGTILTAHVRFAWRAKRNRGNGVLFLSTFGILTVTGYGLYYAGGERLWAWTSWIHLGVGLVVPILLVVHILLGKRTRAPSRASKTPPLAVENRA
jgi:hypothetical protein